MDVANVGSIEGPFAAVFVDDEVFEARDVVYSVDCDTAAATAMVTVKAGIHDASEDGFGDNSIIGAFVELLESGCAEATECFF